MILVVGIDGLIGGELHRSLTRAGADVVGTSRRPDGKTIRLDLDEPDAFVVPEGVRTAVLCAGIGGLKQCADDPAGTSRINVDSTAKIARRVAAAGGAVIYLSTNLVFDGGKPFVPADEPVRPCCEYGRQKARLEDELRGPRFAGVRLTKVMETLGPRFKAWKQTLLGGGEAWASPLLRFSPVPVKEVSAALAELALNFQPGVFHVSGDRDFSYFEAAKELASAAGAAENSVQADGAGGADLFDPVPTFATLGAAAPAVSSRWRFSPSLDTLTGFLRSL